MATRTNPNPGYRPAVPWVLTIGTICVSCGQPNNQAGNPFTGTRQGYRHRNCPPR